MKHSLRLCSLILTLALSTAATAYVSTPVVAPTSPTQLTPVSAAVTRGLCDALVIPPSPVVVTTGNIVELRVGWIGHTDPSLCTFSDVTTTYALGTFAPGTYELRVIGLPSPGGVGPTQLASTAFIVGVASVESIPTTSPPYLLALVLLIFGSVAALKARRASLVCLTALLFAGAPDSALARQYLQFILSSEPGAPSVESINGFNFSSGGTPPLVGLETGNPTGVFYLLPIRPSGDFLQWLQDVPDTTSAQLYRTFVVVYPDNTDLAAAKAALAADAFVDAVNNSYYIEFSADAEPNSAKRGLAQYHLDELNIGGAWARAGGWSLVGIVDSGIDTQHPALRAFNGPTYIGGNYLAAYSFDPSRYLGEANPPPGTFDDNPDDMEPLPAPDANCVLAGNPPGTMIPTQGGHGSHVAGLIGANAASGLQGTCRHCGIGVWKVATHRCDLTFFPAFPPRILVDRSNQFPVPFSMTTLTQVGAQVMNFSFGGAFPDSYCNLTPTDSICMSLRLATENDILMVGASGNHRTQIQFPAADPRVISVGGTVSGGAVWDEAVGGNEATCPIPGTPIECGTNRSATLLTPRQELVTGAFQVVSTFYRNLQWYDSVLPPTNPRLRTCGDAADGTNGDGNGLCTGTSMSAPQIAGAAGLLRSINPLLPRGNPSVSIPFGIRNVLITTTDRAIGGLPWTQELGYGIPNIGRAAGMVLGTVSSTVIRNRVTPLFQLYSPGATDYAMVATPQNAVTLYRYQAASYTTVPSGGNFIGGGAIAGFSAFSAEVGANPPQPRASAFVLTTEYKQQSNHPNLTPLYLLDRIRAWPLGCSPGVGCNDRNRDFILVTGQSSLESAVAQGYRFLGLQGYVFALCGAEPGCIPAFAQALYTKCKASEDDCATFLESSRSAFEGAGYTAVLFGDGRLGYAFPNVDSDADGVISGMEAMVGMNPSSADSDGDGTSDGVEFPLAGVSLSDPCAGPAVTCTLADNLFRDGFE